MSLFAALPLFAAVAQQMVALPPAFSGEMPDGMRFEGGPYAGLGVGQVVTPDGKSFRGLLPSKPAASPVRAHDRAAIEAFIAGRTDPAASSLAGYLAKDALFANCPKKGAPCEILKASPIKFVEPVTANTYVLENGHVRVEWLYGKALYYISEVELKDGKVSRVRTQPAWMPLTMRKGSH